MFTATPDDNKDDDAHVPLQRPPFQHQPMHMKAVSLSFILARVDEKHARQGGGGSLTATLDRRADGGVARGGTEELTDARRDRGADDEPKRRGGRAVRRAPARKDRRRALVRTSHIWRGVGVGAAPHVRAATWGSAWARRRTARRRLRRARGGWFRRGGAAPRRSPLPRLSLSRGSVCSTGKRWMRGRGVYLSGKGG
ncbi:hypothetical protein DAI22_05g083601 [Oryza sativa Japonica Group]|nr:hypothetical protein DAI22_05g083601 [Oryza sativa Japonica Group]